MTCFDKEGCRMFHVVGSECPCVDNLEKQLEQLKNEDPIKWIELTGGYQPGPTQPLPQQQPYVPHQPPLTAPGIWVTPLVNPHGPHDNYNGTTWTSSSTIMCDATANTIASTIDDLIST